MDDDDDDDDVIIEDECDDDDKEHGFYWELFNGDEVLKEKYVKGCLGGVCEFTCLVCGGVSEKHGKRFKDCVGLVQHAVTVNKTKRRRGHRVFGKVVCRVLGWDIDRLPSSSVAECKNAELQGTDNNADKDFNTASSSTGLNQIMDSGNSNRKVDDVLVDGESMVCEDSAVITNVEEENKTKQVLDESVGNCQQSLQELVINNGAGSSTSKKVDDME
uniref:Uncharacterized protein n=1 Tax=Tanacetum cinerariifolium TaxID=118510 RepID=A0A6L2K3Z8_TANCI|nr:hypothetical protein [Tanacetum cinerariifolium]